jgi:hypothetical protein
MSDVLHNELPPPSQYLQRARPCRALRAAHGAGGVARIEISRDDGTITLLLGEPLKVNGAVPEAEPTPLEQWRAKRGGQS